MPILKSSLWPAPTYPTKSAYRFSSTRIGFCGIPMDRGYAGTAYGCLSCSGLQTRLETNTNPTILVIQGATIMSKERSFICCCCGGDFRSSLPQDPERDRGYGKCPSCLPDLAVDRFKYPLPSDTFSNVEDALAVLKKTA